MLAAVWARDCPGWGGWRKAASFSTTPRLNHDASAITASMALTSSSSERLRVVMSWKQHRIEARSLRVIVSAETGRGAIEVLQSQPDVDIVLMDIMMPEMDGYETTRAMRELPEFKSLPIVALTAKAMKGDREKSIASGASDYITKPVDVDQLLSLMRVWLYQ